MNIKWVFYGDEAYVEIKNKINARLGRRSKLNKWDLYIYGNLDCTI